MRGTYIGIGLLLIGSLAVILPVACLSQQRTLALVNDQPITAEDLRQRLIIQEGARMLLEMVDTQLIFQVAAQAGVTITEPELDLKVQQAVARIGSERDFEAELKRGNRTKNAFRQELRAEALLERLALANHPLDDVELRKYYDTHKREFSHGAQVRLRLMLFRDRANADTVVEALKDPQADFAGLASAFSEDPATKENGGDTGFVERDAFAKPISDRAFTMKPGEVSGVFQVPDGWAIVRLEEQRPAAVEPFAGLRETLRARVQVQHLDQAMKDWLNRARAEAQISIPDPFLAEHVRLLIAAETPFQPSNLAPGIPMAPR